MNTEETENYFDDEHTITDGDLNQVAAAIEEADSLYQKYTYLAVPKMPCPECGGTGSIGAGSLGGICVGCMGARVVDMPGADEPDIPDFRSMRRALSDYSIALADQQLPDGHKGKIGLMLPPASTIPKPAAIEDMTQRIKQASKELTAGDGSNVGLLKGLPKPKPFAAGTLGDDGVEYTDAELDDCIDEDTK